MNTEVLVALLSSGASLIVAGVSIFANNRVIAYKVDDLKAQVEKHNNLVERVAYVERDLKTAFIRIDEQREEIKELRNDR